MAIREPGWIKPVKRIVPARVQPVSELKPIASEEQSQNLDLTKSSYELVQKKSFIGQFNNVIDNYSRFKKFRGKF